MSGYLKAIYSIKSNKIKEAVKALIIGQSIGNPHLRSHYENAEIIKQYSAQLSHISNVSSDLYQVEILFPIKMFTKGSFTHLLAVLMGGQIDIDIIQGCRLIRLETPEEFINNFPGPKFGIQGIRDKLSLYNRPLIGGIIKPKTGLTLPLLTEIIKAMIDGGIDFIKEDEILGEIECAPLFKRLEIIDKILEGTRVIYAPAINHPLTQYQQVAKALNNCPNIYGYHLNIWAGLDAFSFLSSLTNKISFYQKSGDGVITKGNFSIAFEVWCMLVRLAGADMVNVGMMGGYLNERQEILQKRLEILQNSYYGSKGTLPSFSCGAIPAHVPVLQEAFGNDIMISAGGFIHSHKLGTTEGVREFRRYADACVTSA